MHHICISDETALQLLKLTNEGVDLQILDRTAKGGGDFLENFRKMVCNLSSTKLYSSSRIIVEYTACT